MALFWKQKSFFRHPAPKKTWHRSKAVILLVILLFSFLYLNNGSAQAATQQDGIMTYGVSANTTPQVRTYSGSGNSFGAAAGTVAGAAPLTMVTRVSPITTEAITGYVDSTGTLRVMCYNGTSWTNEWNVSVGGTGTTRRFDIAYETNSGDAMVLYSTNTGTTNEMAYRTKAGTTGCGTANWATAANLDPVRTSGVVQWIKIAWDTRASSNILTAAWADANSDLSAMQWSGTAWGNEPAAALSTSLFFVTTAQDLDDFDLTYESLSGDLMIGWGLNNGGTTTGQYNTCTGGTATCTWGTTTAIVASGKGASNISMASNPNTDEIVIATIDTNATSDLFTRYWSGTAMSGPTTSQDGTVGAVAAGTKIVATGWLTSGATKRSVIVYNDGAGATNIGWWVGNGSTFTVQTDFSPTPAFGTPQKRYDIQVDPLNKDRLLFSLSDTNNALFAKRLIMTSTPAFTWTNADGSAALETSLGQAAVGDFSFAYWRSPPAYSQTAYRWFANADSVQPGSALAAENTTATLPNILTIARLRMALTNNGTDLAASGQAFKLQFATSTGGPWTDVGVAQAWQFKNNLTPASGANITSALLSGSPVLESYQEANPTANNPNALTTTQKGEWDFALDPSLATTGTTYYFRATKSDGTALTAYTQYPQISITSTNTAPNSPSSLAQKKTDDTVLATGAWVNATSVKFTASVSDGDASDTDQLCVEKKAIGTAFSNTEDLCGTGVAYSGTPVTATVTITGITDATEYHWQARVKDAAGAYSSWVSYDVNAESARDFGVDTTAPTGGTVFDGTTTSVDAAYNDGSLSSLSANWSGFDATVSGLARYDYSIGTTAGGTDIKSWTSNGTSTAVTATGLTLQTSQLYFVNVRAVDNAGNVQTGVSSNGQLVAPSLSFSVSPSSLTFAALNAADSYTDTKTTTLTTSTNAFGGYVIRLAATDLLRGGSFTVPDFNGGTYASPDSWQSGDTGFGYTSSDTTIQGVNKFQAATCPGGSTLSAPGCYAQYSQSKPGDIVADHTTSITGSPVSNEQFTITHRITASPTQAAQTYAMALLYGITAIY